MSSIVGDFNIFNDLNSKECGLKPEIYKKEN
jgi:hypothetical protein